MCTRKRRASRPFSQHERSSREPRSQAKDALKDLYFHVFCPLLLTNEPPAHPFLAMKLFVENPLANPQPSPGQRVSPPPIPPPYLQDPRKTKTKGDAQWPRWTGLGSVGSGLCKVITNWSSLVASWLRFRHCHWDGRGSIPGPGTSACHQHSQKRKSYHGSQLNSVKPGHETESSFASWTLCVKYHKP